MPFYHCTKFQNVWAVFHKEKPRLWVYHWGVWCISAISAKQSILKTPQHHQCCLNSAQILYSGKYELVLPIQICFIKIGIVLSDILTSQKCIKWGWCIIRGWMTVVSLCLAYICSLKIANNSYRSTSQLSIPIHNTKREMSTDCYFVGRMSTTKLQSVDLKIQVSLWIIIEM